MAAVLVTGPTVTQDFPRGGCSHNHYSFLPTHGETAQAESTCLPVCIPRWFTRPKTVTHPGTNRAWQRVMELRRNSMCIFLFSCNFYHQDSINRQLHTSCECHDQQNSAAATVPPATTQKCMQSERIVRL